MIEPFVALHFCVYHLLTISCDQFISDSHRRVIERWGKKDFPSVLSSNNWVLRLFVWPLMLLAADRLRFSHVTEEIRKDLIGCHFWQSNQYESSSRQTNFWRSVAVSGACFSVLYLHRLQHFGVADQLILRFFFVGSATFFVFESETMIGHATEIDLCGWYRWFTFSDLRRSCRWQPDRPRRSSREHAETDRPLLDREFYKRSIRSRSHWIDPYRLMKSCTTRSPSFWEFRARR